MVGVAFQVTNCHSSSDRCTKLLINKLANIIERSMKQVKVTKSNKLNLWRTKGTVSSINTRHKRKIFTMLNLNTDLMFKYKNYRNLENELVIETKMNFFIRKLLIQ